MCKAHQNKLLQSVAQAVQAGVEEVVLCSATVWRRQQMLVVVEGSLLLVGMSVPIGTTYLTLQILKFKKDPHTSLVSFPSVAVHKTYANCCGVNGCSLGFVRSASRCTWYLMTRGAISAWRWAHRISSTCSFIPANVKSCLCMCHNVNISARHAFSCYSTGCDVTYLQCCHHQQAIWLLHPCVCIRNCLPHFAHNFWHGATQAALHAFSSHG